MADLQSAQDEARCELTPPLIQLQFEIEEKESFFKYFMEHNNVNLDSDSLQILLLDVYKHFKGDWYLKASVRSKTIKISGAKKQPLSFATMKAAWVRNTFQQQTIPKYPIETNVVNRQQVENIEMKILHESTTGAKIAQDIEIVLDSDLLIPEQKKNARNTGECYDFRC